MTMPTVEREVATRESVEALRDLIQANHEATNALIQANYEALHDLIQANHALAQANHEAALALIQANHEELSGRMDRLEGWLKAMAIMVGAGMFVIIAALIAAIVTLTING